MTRIRRLIMFLEAHFGDVEFHMPIETEDEQEQEQGEDNSEPSLLVSLDEADARINLISMVCNLLLSPFTISTKTRLFL